MRIMCIWVCVEALLVEPPHRGSTQYPGQDSVDQTAGRSTQEALGSRAEAATGSHAGALPMLRTVGASISTLWQTNMKSERGANKESHTPSRPPVEVPCCLGRVFQYSIFPAS